MAVCDRFANESLGRSAHLAALRIPYQGHRGARPQNNKMLEVEKYKTKTLDVQMTGATMGTMTTAQTVPAWDLFNRIREDGLSLYRDL